MSAAQFDLFDHQCMARALILAEQGVYSTDPNPRVGCVLAKSEKVIAEGYHRLAGSEHAEINALAAASESVQGATAYVTLEPCSHQGKTPPCADALINAGVARVVVAMQDPNPLVSGQGVERLRQAGIHVDVGLMSEAAAQLNPGFVKRMSLGMPFIRVKLAGSLDGRTAMASGESHWITGDAARQDVQAWRARSSAILTGVDTVIMDDPSMNVRWDVLGGRPQPIRVIMDSFLRTPPSSKLLTLDGEVWVYHLPSADESRQSALLASGARLFEMPSVAGSTRVASQLVLRDLAAKGMNEVHVEAGSTLSGSLLEIGLVDELVLYVAPHIMGDGGRGLFHLPGLKSMSQRVPLRIADIRAVGDDWRVIARPDYEEVS